MELTDSDIDALLRMADQGQAAIVGNVPKLKQEEALFDRILSSEMTADQARRLMVGMASPTVEVSQALMLASRVQHLAQAVMSKATQVCLQSVGD